MDIRNRDYLIAEFMKEIIRAKGASYTGSGSFTVQPQAVAGIAAQLADAAIDEMREGGPYGQLRSKRTE